MLQSTNSLFEMPKIYPYQFYQFKPKPRDPNSQAFRENEK